MSTQLDRYLHLNLKTRHLRLLILLEDLGSLKKVAEATHVTLPAVSRALAELEKGLGLDLFTRSPQGFRATPYGECLIRYARNILTDIQQVRDELNSLYNGSGGKINIGVYPASTSVLTPKALLLLKQRSPTTNAQVIEATRHVLLPQLWEGKIDLIVGRLPAVPPSSGFDERPLLEEKLVVVTGPQHPLARRKRLQWSDLQSYPWVLPPHASQIREPFERVLEKQGLEFQKNYIETMSVQVARSYLYCSDAISVLANTAARDRFQPLAVLPLPLPQMLRPTGIMWNRNRPFSAAAKLMMDCLEDAAKEIRETEI
ncbi:LysR substrate-binding domain-containing protein [Caballeronia sp. LP006]|uniref:LysR substrate-binding domain-containing protein n=1 Tax=Caballeronia sp. LP006 TaxID=3038552 RepID=UPI0028555661|nr:LysR substrate-binding domain-containing protein [Caballeronia sp. LP006]MDR5832519.1 LysR substrate-binding domain-containing protein [Caballeronia sp. LP006]